MGGFGFLWKDDGEILRESKEIDREIISFFSDLYAPPPLLRPFMEGLD